MGRTLYPDGTIGLAPKEHVFLTGTMKSGGVHITNCLGRILGWRRNSLASWQQEGMTEHDINPHVAWTVLPQGAYVFHMHMRAWGANVGMLAQWNVRPIVLIRNVADIIVAVRDNALMDYQRELDPKGMPGVYLPSALDSMSREEQELFLVQNMGPWLLSFYVSWKRQQGVPCLWVSYEDHFKDQVKSFRRMLEWVGWGTNTTDEAIAQIADSKPHNFNKGVSGRGRQLSKPAMDALESLIDAWGPDWAPMLRRDMLTFASEDRPMFSRLREGLRM